MGSQKADQRKNKQKQQGEKSDPATKKMIADPRFAAVHSDPRFQDVPRNKAKVSIDSRFNRMFTDKNFSSSSLSIDKRGKAKDKSSSNSLRHYYRIDEEEKKRKNVDTEDDDEDDEEEESEGQVLKQTKKPGLEALESSEESEDAEDEDEDAESGGSESDTDTDTDEEEDVEVYMEDEAEVQEESIPEIDKETHRLAVVNMDWRHVKAVDLYIMLSSFLPKDGQILSVAVYPSEFGLQRMKEEEVHGPVGLFDDDDEEKSDEDDGNDEIDNEKLRAYEKSRLKYYYAVVECDSIATADYLYKSCDGVEFERSSNVLDLRFIPDSVEFKHLPRDVATEAPADYDGLDFETQALQQSKINLTWDEDEPHRARTLKRKFNADQLAEMELKEFLASDEGETDDDEDNASEDLNDKKHLKRDMYRALVQFGDGSDDEGDGEEEGQDMEVTFNTGLEDISKRILEKKDKKFESVWEAYLRKRSEKKKARKSKSKFSSEDESSDTDQEVPEEADDFFVEEPSAKRSKEAKGKRVSKEEQQLIADTEAEASKAEASRAELELLLADDKETNPGVKGYNLKHMKAKGKKGKQDTKEDKIPTIDYDDPRFTSLFKSPLFALDPTDPQFKRSAAYARQVAAQKQQKGSRGKLEREDKLEPNEAELQPEVNPEQAQTKREKLELSSLVRSLKMKAKQVQVPSDAKTSKKDEKAQSRGTTDEKPSLPPKKQSTKKKTKALGN